MMLKRLFLSLLCVTVACGARAATTFEQYVNFPLPAFGNGAYVVTGTGLPDGRLLVWDGDAVYRQFDAGADRFDRVASGYQGDTAFVALSPDGQTCLLGQGYAGNIYSFDPGSPADYTAQSVVASVPGNYSGVFLTNTLVLLDVGRLDFSGSELHIIDLDAAKRGAKAAPRVGVAKDSRYFAQGKSLVVDKPPFGYAASLAVDYTQDMVYAMDANARELRAFAIADLVNAFNTATPLDWATDGTLIGSAGQFYSGGAAGVQPGGNVIVGGSEGYLLPGGIQVVDPSLALPASASVLETLDPTGNQDYYYVIYNAYTDTITGVTFSGAAYSSGALASVPVVGALGLAVLGLGMGIAGVRRARRAR